MHAIIQNDPRDFQNLGKLTWSGRSKHTQTNTGTHTRTCDTITHSHTQGTLAPYIVQYIFHKARLSSYSYACTHAHISPLLLCICLVPMCSLATAHVAFLALITRKRVVHTNPRPLLIWYPRNSKFNFVRVL